MKLAYLNDEEFAILPLWRSLTSEQQDMILYLVRTLASEQPLLPDHPSVIPFPIRRSA